MTPSKTSPTRELASKVLNSETLMKAFEALTTRPQYAVTTSGEEFVPIIKACRLEETDEHRLALAARVLSAALTTLEFEIQQEHRTECAAHAPKMPGHIPGGYQ